MAETKNFPDFPGAGLVDLEVTPKGKLVLYFTQGDTVAKVVVRERALSQLLKLLGISVRDWRKGRRPDPAALAAVIKNGNYVFSTVAVPEAPGVYVAYRVATEQYTAVPHGVLFRFTDEVLRDLGVEVLERRVTKFYKRTAVEYTLYKANLNYWRPGDVLMAKLVVSNANTAEDGIHVTGLVQINTCSNAVIPFRGRVVVHVGEVAEILARVRDAIIEVLGKMRRRFAELVNRIQMLDTVEMPPSVIEAWLKAMEERMPKKYRKWFETVLAEHRARAGDTAQAVFQTLTYFTTRLANKNPDLAMRLNSEARKLLDNPEKYVEAYARAR